MKSTLKIAIASDLHCTYVADKSNTLANTYLLSDLLKFPTNKHPVESLKKLIEREHLCADILVCPGDITDKINQQGLVSGWKYLNEIKAALKSDELAITIGNHDVDFKGYHGKGPFELIKNLDTDIPTSNDDINSFFWHHNYCILESDSYIFLILNSSFNQTAKDLSTTTIIDESTIEKIKADLEQRKGENKFRVAVSHHHPLHHSNANLQYRDCDFIDQSDKLLSLLEMNDFNLYIHGHKHDPRLIYFNRTVPVLASGSFSATTNLLDLGAENTFHLIDVDLNTKKGKIVSWVYLPRSGWVQRLDCYFPCFTGFGCTTSISDLASQCEKWFAATGKEFANYNDLQAAVPDLDYLIPSEQEKLNSVMETKFGLFFEPNLPNKPKKIFKN